MRPRWKGCCSGEVLSGAWRWLFQATAPSVGTVVACCVTCLEAKGEEALRAGGKGRGEHSIRGGCCRDKQTLYWDQLGTGNVVTAMNPSLTVGFIGGQRHCRAGDSFWSSEGRGRDEQDTLRACTCRRKRWEKDLGDVPLKSGRLSRGEPAYPLCTGELRKSRAMLAAGGGVSRTCRMALSCGKRWQEVGMQPCPHATTRDAWGYPWDPPPARGGVGYCWGRSPTPWAPWPTGRQREVSMGRRGAGDTHTPSPRRRGHFYHVLFAKFCPDRANSAVQHC